MLLQLLGVGQKVLTLAVFLKMKGQAPQTIWLTFTSEGRSVWAICVTLPRAPVSGIDDFVPYIAGPAPETMATSHPGPDDPAGAPVSGVRQ